LRSLTAPVKAPLQCPNARTPADCRESRAVDGHERPLRAVAVGVDDLWPSAPCRCPTFTVDQDRQARGRGLLRVSQRFEQLGVVAEERAFEDESSDRSTPCAARAADRSLRVGSAASGIDEALLVRELHDLIPQGARLPQQLFDFPAARAWKSSAVWNGYLDLLDEFPRTRRPSWRPASWSSIFHAAFNCFCTARSTCRGGRRARHVCPAR